MTWAERVRAVWRPVSGRYIGAAWTVTIIAIAAVVLVPSIVAVDGARARIHHFQGTAVEQIDIDLRRTSERLQTVTRQVDDQPAAPTTMSPPSA